MQTLKTAIVVLLMMTVMYGCYVSLTTSPESLPEHVAQLIEESESYGDLGIDAGLPDSLASLGIADRSPYDAIDSTTGDLGDGPAELTFSDGPSTPVRSMDTAHPGAMPGTQPGAIHGGMGQSGTMGMNASFSDRSTSDRDAAMRHFPKPSDQSAAVVPDFGRDYPSTRTADLQFPDPNALASEPSSWQSDNKSVNWEAIAESAPAHPGASQAVGQSGSASAPNLGLANAIKAADRQYAADQPAEALATLSLFYNTPEMTEADRTALLGRLDPLAATVIYSRKHLLEQPHRVGQAETLMEIAARYDLPWQLLANINAIEDPVTVLPGTELKVVRGPFRAEVDLTRNELTIFLGDLYAGRFPISIGSDPAPQEGSYTVQDKQSARTFYDKNGSPIPPGDARNPYGNMWLDLGKQLCIHGSPDRRAPSDRGCISLRGADADDLFGILTQGSAVTIRR